MHIQITLFIIWIRILHSTKQKKIFFQSETVYLLLKFIPQFSLTQYIPACFYTLVFQKFHCINRQFICFLCSQPSYCQYPLSTVCITKSAWKLCLSADFLPVDQIVKYQSFIPAFRIHIIKHRLYFSGYRKNPVKIQITISVQFSGITGVFIIYM